MIAVSAAAGELVAEVQRSAAATIPSSRQNTVLRVAKKVLLVL